MGLALARRGARAASRRRSGSSLPISAANPNPTVSSTGGAPGVHAALVGMPHDGQSHQGFPGLLGLGGGHLVAVYRSAARHSLTVRGSAGHGVILLAESIDYGATWTQRTIVDSPALNDDRDPNITVLPGGTWLLTYPTWVAPDNANSPPTGCVLNYRTSTDQGVTWSAETRILPTQAGSTYPGLNEYLATTSPVLIATDGSIVIPATGRQLAGQTHYSSFMLRAATLAGPWTATVIGDGPTDARSYDEPYAQKLNNGSYLALSRHGGDKVARYTSADGITWNPLTVGLNIGGGGRPSFIQLANDTILMGTRGSETQNQVRFSRDLGVTWSPASDVPPLAGRLATYLAFTEVSPNVVACAYSTEDTLEDGRMYFRYILDGVEGAPPTTVNVASFTTAVGNTGTAPTVSKPTGVVTGDTLILLVNQRATTATYTPPTGWASLGSVANTGKMQAFHRIADGTEPSSLAVATTGSNPWVAACLRISNAASTPPAFLSATGSSTTPTTPATPVATTGSLVLGLFAGGNANHSGVTPPAGWDEVIDIRAAATSTNPWLDVSSFMADAGTVPAASVTVPTQTWMAATLVVPPAP